MNNYANTIIIEFISRENVSRLYDSISKYFNHPRVNSYLKDHLPKSAEHFADSIEQELKTSDPLPGITIRDQLTCFNNQFIQDRIAYIKSHVLMTDNEVPMYVVKDGLPTSRYGLRYHQRSADEILKSWNMNSGRGVQSREDPSGDIYPNNPYHGSNWGFDCNDTKSRALYNEQFHGGKNADCGYNASNRLETGIMFCDQGEVGTQNHVEQYENTSYKLALNDNRARMHEATAFGVSTRAADERLLNRRIFRSNEAGVENGIPRYEQRLYGRNIDREVSEGLRNAEKGCSVSGYDMSSLRRRVDYKNQVRMQYHPNCNTKSTMHLQANNTRVPDDLRYC